PLGYASLHYERAQPMTLANDLKVFNFRWQSGVQFWVAVHILVPGLVLSIISIFMISSPLA
ncbi:MAG: hypothetical protein SPL26_01110, partial [Bacteroidales bacterium]|nr:hypothetical protein [Bacteroidales bacterium]MDY6384112.1 hypothetical protein [Bacteroidales bacterium]